MGSIQIQLKSLSLIALATFAIISCRLDITERKDVATTKPVESITVEPISINLNISGTVPSEYKESVSSFQSAIDSVSKDGKESIIAPNSPFGTLILANSKTGKPLLMGLSKNGKVDLGFESTANAIARMCINPIEFIPDTTVDISAKLASLASYPSLLEEVKLGNKNENGILNDSVISKGLQVARDFLQSEKVSASNGSLILRKTAIPITDEVYATPPLPYYFFKSALFGESIWLENAPGGVTIHNESRLYWSVESSDESGKLLDIQQAEWLPFTFWSILPVYYSTPTTTAIVGNPTKFSVSIKQNLSTTTKHLVFFTNQSLLLVLNSAANQKGGVKHECLEKVAEKILNDKLPAFLTEMEKEKHGENFIEYLKKMFVFQEEDLDKHLELLSECGVKFPPLKSAFFNNLFGFWGKINFAKEFGPWAELLQQIIDYWKFDAHVIVCKEKGEVQECLQSLIITQKNIEIRIDESQNLDAVTLGVSGNNLNKIYETKWSIADSKIAKISDDGVVTGMSEGDTKIYAKTGGVSDTSVLTVRDNMKRAYCLDGKTLKFQAEINRDSLFHGLYEYYNCISKLLESTSYYKNGVLDGPIKFYGVDTREFTGILGTDVVIDYSKLARHEFRFNAINGNLEGNGGYVGDVGFVIEKGKILRLQGVDNLNTWCGIGGSADYRGTVKFENGVFSAYLESTFCGTGKPRAIDKYENNYWIQNSTQYCDAGSIQSHLYYDFQRNTKEVTSSVCPNANP